ncbi:MAG: hypothetical protein HY924_04370 [Elusimicrobia bacterium]|nr:hypothetical protein [Elusimicrobiota bacterium]
MLLVSMKGAQPKPVHFRREKDIYALLKNQPHILEKETQYRMLLINKGPEKGPDFIAVNRRGHLLLGEVKKGPLSLVAWRQIRRYAKRFCKMRKDDLNGVLVKAGIGPLQKTLKGKRLLSSTGWKALLNPSRRKLQLVLVAEGFSDRVLQGMSHDLLGNPLRSKVKDVKCVELRMYRVSGSTQFAIASVIAGNRRQLRG